MKEKAKYRHNEQKKEKYAQERVKEFSQTVFTQIENTIRIEKISNAFNHLDERIVQLEQELAQLNKEIINF